MRSSMARRRRCTRKKRIENDVFTSIRTRCAERGLRDAFGKCAAASHGHWTGLRSTRVDLRSLARRFAELEVDLRKRSPRTAPLVRSPHHGASLVGDDVFQESWPAWSLRVPKPRGLLLRQIFHRQLACD